MLIRTILLLSITLFFGGCASSSLTEQQRYEKLQDGIKYNAYSKLSKAAIGASVEVFNTVRENEGKTPTSKPYVHAVTGFVWSLGWKPDFAIAETDLALKKGQEPRERYVALSVQSIAFYQKGWDGLGDKYGAQAETLIGSESLPRDYDNEQILSHLAVGSMALYKGNSVLAQNSFSKLGNKVDKPWLPDLVRVISVFTNGSYSEAFRLLKGLVDNESLSESEQKSLNLLKSNMQKMVLSNKVSNVAVNGMFSSLLYDMIIEKSGESTKTLAQSIKSFQDKIDL